MTLVDLGFGDQVAERKTLFSLLAADCHKLAKSLLLSLCCYSLCLRQCHHDHDPHDHQAYSPIMGLCCPGPSPVLGGTRSRVCALSFSPSKCICQLLSLYLCKYKHIFLRPPFHTCLEISISLKIVLWENCTRLKNRLQKKHRS